MPQARLPEEVRHKLHEGEKVEASIVVKASVAQVYRFWRAFKNLPSFMSHLKSVECLSPCISHWVWVTRAAGLSLEWDAEIIADSENRMISWQTLPGSAVAQAGSVWFRPLGDGSETEIRVHLIYHIPGGKLGAKLAEILGEDPQHVLQADLRRLKKRLESPDARQMN